ncbi:MAG TPA: PQQ-dependent dehydrogenase, methanol/ethanol family [Bryobacteraceae bacterium]|nr:PQQ-dependent dehydrogenase, methanol/ethanol family [Bryobacteraceae bacterium]
MRVLLVFLTSAILQSVQLSAQAPEEKDDLKNPVAGKPEAIAAGRKLYLEGCSGCHGPTAEGGRGPNLAKGDQIRGATNRHLLSVLNDGVKGSDMPPSGLPADKIWELAAYLRDLTAVAFDSSAPGDAAAGGALFFGTAGCSNCHTIRGRGGFPGPDLSNIARGRSYLQLRESLLDPDAEIADGYGGVTVLTKTGQAISGVARDSTNYAIQVLDTHGDLHRLLKADLREVVFRKGSLMPRDYGERLTADEIQNLLAFLGRQAIRDGAASLPAAMQPAVGARYDLIREGASANWLTYAGDYAGHRHSPLAQITSGNVGSLVSSWVYHVDGATHLEATPLVYDGVMYVTNSNEVHALDARTGRPIWKYHDDQVKRSDVNRGVAILGDSVFFATSDAHLVALNRKTGGALWDREFADTTRGAFATLAPMALKDRVIVGVSGGDTGVRGFIAAYAAATGEELWRFWTVPAKGEPGAESWGELGPDWGGAATWLTGTYDAGTNILYWTTGNPWPDFYGGARHGDNLYSDSIVALDADTGKLKWYFQFTPHDTHDWDAQAWPVLLDSTYEGRPRKLLLHANRNGYFYVLDRITGEFLRATPYVERLNWAKGIDAKGRPIENPGLEPSPNGTRVCPSVRGASNWMSPSYNPATGLLYVPTLEQCDLYSSSAKTPEPMKNFAGTGGESISKEPGKFYLRALDPRTGAKRWEYPMTGRGDMWAGTVSTAGGVVFFGDDDGQLVAVDAVTGQHIWHYYLGQTLTASPITFLADGKQYVTIVAATDVFTFGLFGPAK